MARATLGIALCCAALCGDRCGAQALPVPPMPGHASLLVPDGPIRQSQMERYRVSIDDESIVARLHVAAGDRLIVLLPDGRLESVPAAEAESTDEPFTPLSARELSVRLSSGALAGMRTRSTNHFLFIYDCSDAFQRATSTLLETMYPKLVAWCGRQGVPAAEPEFPLVVVVLKSRSQWQELYGQQLDTQASAYYDAVSNRVVLYERSDLLRVAPELAFKEAVSTIAHEGVHQILHNVGVQQRLADWPLWFTEGLAEYCAPTSVARGARWKGLGEPNDLRIKSLERVLADRDVPPSPATLQDLITSDELTPLGYAWAWGTTHYLATRRAEELRAYLQDISRREPLVAYDGDAEMATFARHFGNDYAAVYTGIVQHVRGLPYSDPVEGMTHYVARWEVLEGRTLSRRAVARTSPQEIIEWRDEQTAQLAPEQRRSVNFVVEAVPGKSAADALIRRWMNGQ